MKPPQPQPALHMVYCPCASMAEAEEIAEALLADQLVACANILPEIHSRYVWEGSLHRETESVLLLKTLEVHLPELRSRIEALHSYEVPAILAWPVPHANPDFLSWLENALK
jgi:periplasmic divalent cation tolerance protein